MSVNDITQLEFESAKQYAITLCATEDDLAEFMKFLRYIHSTYGSMEYFEIGDLFVIWKGNKLQKEIASKDYYFSNFNEHVFYYDASQVKEEKQPVSRVQNPVQQQKPQFSFGNRGAQKQAEESKVAVPEQQKPQFSFGNRGAQKQAEESKVAVPEQSSVMKRVIQKGVALPALHQQARAARDSNVGSHGNHKDTVSKPAAVQNSSLPFNASDLQMGAQRLKKVGAGNDRNESKDDGMQKRGAANHQSKVVEKKPEPMRRSAADSTATFGNVRSSVAVENPVAHTPVKASRSVSVVKPSIQCNWVSSRGF